LVPTDAQEQVKKSTASDLSCGNEMPDEDIKVEKLNCIAKMLRTCTDNESDWQVYNCGACNTRLVKTV